MIRAGMLGAALVAVTVAARACLGHLGGIRSSPLGGQCPATRSSTGSANSLTPDRGRALSGGPHALVEL